MAILNIRVVIGGSSPLTDTPANRARILVFGARVARNVGFGNIPKKVAKGQHAYDLNNPNISGSIAVTSYSRAHFDSIDLIDAPELAGEIASFIDKGIIIVEDDAAAGVPLNRAAIMAFV